jgi:hypothetical protein
MIRSRTAAIWILAVVALAACGSRTSLAGTESMMRPTANETSTAAPTAIALRGTSVMLTGFPATGAIPTWAGRP